MSSEMQDAVSLFKKCFFLKEFLFTQVWLAILANAALAVPADNLLASLSPGAGTADKSIYDVFNSTPDDEMRSFCSDRPTKSTLPCTVDAGHFQYEADLLNWSHYTANNVTQNTYLFLNPTFKVGITNRTEIDLNIPPLEEVVTHDKATHTNTNLIGVGDLYTRLKYNIIGNDSSDQALALVPFIKIPTAESGIGNKAFEGGLNIPLTFACPHDFTFGLDPEIEALQNSKNEGYHVHYQWLFNLSHALFSDKIIGYAELWSGINNDPSGTVTQISADFAVSWLLQPTLQMDVWTNIGLNDKTPDIQTMLGISQRF